MACEEEFVKVRILITGSTGIVGAHVTERLREQGHEVLGLDRNRAGEENIVKTDIIFPEEVHKAFKAFIPEIVIHMAGEVGRLNGEEYPERMLRTNILGTLNIIKSCLEFRSKLINFSTSEVYGSSFDVGVASEDDSLPALGQTNIYSISKMAGEAVVKHYVDNYHLRGLTVRPFMLYGPGEKPNPFRSALTNFVWQALTRKPMTVHKGTVRSWCYYDDFIDGLSLLFDLRMEKWEAFNIGNDTNYTTAEETARVVCEETGAPETLINLVDPPKALMSPIKRASIEKMRRLGFSPKVTLHEGIKRMITWQKENLLLREGVKGIG